MFRTRSRSSQDFSVGAYKQFDTERPRWVAPFADAVRAFGRVVATLMHRLLNAMYESRRRQAEAVLNGRDDLIGAAERRAAWPLGKPRCAREAQSKLTAVDINAGQAVYGVRIRCSITGAPCEDAHAYLCDEWGCARKGGFSPISHENF